LFEDADGGTVILPSESDIARDRSEVEDLEIEATKLSASSVKEERARGEAQLRAVKSMNDIIDRQEKARKKLLPQAEKITYQLVRPTYGNYLLAECEAKTIDPDSGAITIDQSKLQETLLLDGIEGKSAEDVRDLPPNVARVLAQRLLNASYPDPTRIRF